MHRQLIVCLIALSAATACAQETKGAEDPVVARFAGQAITQSQLERDEELSLQLVSIRQQEYDLKRRSLEGNLQPEDDQRLPPGVAFLRARSGKPHGLLPQGW